MIRGDESNCIPFNHCHFPTGAFVEVVAFNKNVFEDEEDPESEISNGKDRQCEQLVPGLIVIEHKDDLFLKLLFVGLLVFQKLDQSLNIPFLHLSSALHYEIIKRRQYRHNITLITKWVV